ncbi:amidinotransferase family protein [Liquorilactobacillus aquaticus DSM 21051]|uniref:Amidinotransferase family protein n=1 Tax=Liquorilactobacillus aquaticus DSM 21051 TaxID=1423725 RepID=A0A0R2CZM0_9LACO|nr:arginine deiminase family protein [Liquorilactobacillus aquaticus]KRM97454.1 amidinotransferase family protein [Liquorilactobacillus aquaticus DSM 21051]
MFVLNGTSELKRVLVCPPTYLEEAAPINEISKKYADQPLNRKKLTAEFEQLVEAYQQAGIEVEQQTATPEMTNAVFARDFGGCVKEGYILGRFKKELRFPERRAYENKMKKLGVPKILEIKEGYFEGGDFAFLTEKVIAVGIIDRTDQKGFEELKAGLAHFGYEVYPVPADPRYLHLDMCFNLVDDHLAVAYKEGLPAAFLKLLEKLEIEIIPVPEEAIFKHGCNLESLGAKRVLSLKQNTEVNKALRAHGMKVIELDITETLKAGGGPHCMTFPLQRG